MSGLNALTDFLAHQEELGLRTVCYKDPINGRTPAQYAYPELVHRLVKSGVISEEESDQALSLFSNTIVDIRQLYPEAAMEAIELGGRHASSKPVDTLIVNLFGAPASGKTTTVPDIFTSLKKKGLSAFQIQEYATYLIISGRVRELLREQDLIFTKQKHKQEIAQGKFRFVITESPLLLSSFYAPDDYPASFHEYVRAMWERFNNVNFYIYKKDWSDYDATSRIHDKSAAMQVEKALLNFVRGLGYPVVEVPVGEEPGPWITNYLLEHYEA